MLSETRAEGRDRADGRSARGFSAAGLRGDHQPAVRDSRARGPLLLWALGAAHRSDDGAGAGGLIFIVGGVLTGLYLLGAKRLNARAGAQGVGRLIRSTGDKGVVAVLDSRLRVIGIEGLRVCDLSAMPNINAGNTNAPAMMMGSRCAVSS